MTQTHGMTAAAEVWRVNDDESVATLLEGAYGDCEALRLESTGTELPAGEGMAGAVLARRVPVLLEQIDGEVFERVEAARSAGVVAALGMPVFDESRLSHVVVVMFRGEPGMVGAVELWAGRRGRFELGLTEAYHAGLERFGKVSRHVNFPMGSGLPGLVWQTALPRMMTGLGQSREFLRSSGAESAGLTTGFGYPVIHRNELKAVMLWLSSEQTPLAKRHEVWRCEGRTCRRVTTEAIADDASDLVDTQPFVELTVRERRPVVFETDGNEDGVVLPVLVHDEVRGVGVLVW